MSDERDVLTHRSPSEVLPAIDRSRIRREMRAKRNALSSYQRIYASRRVLRHVLRAQLMRHSQRIAVYRAFDGELDLSPLVRLAMDLKCTIYVPRIVSMRSGKMEFAQLGAPRFRSYRSINPRLLDVVFVPLVAFDEFGWRLGFGAGFYDRKFAFKRLAHRPRPMLIGVAYDFQRVPPQVPSPWDVLLDACVTDRGYFRRRKP
jgi:5-formyltetrahydrofolate cyclo-ligase